MSETQARNHINAPHNQPFQLKGGRPNKKANAWYKRGETNNPKQRKEKNDE